MFSKPFWIIQIIVIQCHVIFDRKLINVWKTTKNAKAKMKIKVPKYVKLRVFSKWLSRFSQKLPPPHKKWNCYLTFQNQQLSKKIKTGIYNVEQCSLDIWLPNFRLIYLFWQTYTWPKNLFHWWRHFSNCHFSAFLDIAQK